MRANSEFTYSTGERTPSRMAAAASISETSSGFIFEFHRSCAQLVQLNRHLLHFGMKFDGPLFPNFSSARVVSVRISSEIVVSRLNMSSNSSRLGKHAPLL